MSKKIYAERDTELQGEFFAKHMDHMTREGLHGKFEIAAELAHRDMELEQALRVIQEIAKSSTSEGGCYYTNLANVNKARRFLQGERRIL